jgi:hypothetical protein
MANDWIFGEDEDLLLQGAPTSYLPRMHFTQGEQKLTTTLLLLRSLLLRRLLPWWRRRFHKSIQGPVIQAAREHLESKYWPDGPVCPHCSSRNAYKLTQQMGMKYKRPGID